MLEGSDEGEVLTPEMILPEEVLCVNYWRWWWGIENRLGCSLVPRSRQSKRERGGFVSVALRFFLVCGFIGTTIVEGDESSNNSKENRS